MSTTTAWLLERQVVETGQVRPAVALGPSGQVSLVWAGHQLHHRFFAAGVWRSEIITDASTGHACVAYDGKGQLHVVYDAGAGPPGRLGTLRLSTYFKDRGQLKHAVKTDDGWVNNTIESRWTGHTNTVFFDLVIDDEDQPQVAFVDEAHACYARRGPTGWTVEEVAPKGPGTVRLAVSQAGLPHLLFARDKTLVHARRDEAGRWQVGQLSAFVDLQEISVIAGPDETLHLAYMHCKKSNDRLMVAHYQAGEWSKPEMIERKGNNGFGNAIAVTRGGVPYVAYRAQKSRYWAGSTRLIPASLRLASRREGKWTVEEVCAKAGWQHALALSADDEPWLAYASTLRDGISLANGQVQTCAAGQGYSERVEALLHKLRHDKRLYLTNRGMKTAIGTYPPSRFWQATIDGASCTLHSGDLEEGGREDLDTTQHASEEAAMAHASEALLDLVSILIEPGAE
ncbi:MAG: hypothetical protein JRH20_16985 [Deltaproteobacteria bacterium]|nr:hypothetical protein [Deltaproteobacteria bacterium]